eukprot:6027148-Pleurochrysis_carterae.AAC.2
MHARESTAAHTAAAARLKSLSLLAERQRKRQAAKQGTSSSALPAAGLCGGLGLHQPASGSRSRETDQAKTGLCAPWAVTSKLIATEDCCDAACTKHAVRSRLPHAVQLEQQLGEDVGRHRRHVLWQRRNAAAITQGQRPPRTLSPPTIWCNCSDEGIAKHASVPCGGDVDSRPPPPHTHAVYHRSKPFEMSTAPTW